jgi:hypothetical protein
LAEYRLNHDAIGKKTHGNPMVLPTSTAIELENYETIRDGVYRIPRGRELYNTGLPSCNIKQLLDYKDTAIVHLQETAGGTQQLWVDNAGIFQIVNSAYSTTIFNEVSGFKIQSTEANSNMYFTTDDGILKMDSILGRVRPTGIPKALGMELSLINSVNWLATGDTVAYRIVWSYKDTNNNLITGAPSERVTIENNSGSDRAVKIAAHIPTEIKSLLSSLATEYSYELYRSSTVAVGVTPPEDFQLVYKKQLVSNDITASMVFIDDLTPEDFRGVSLYTNTTIEGIENSNIEPPRAATIDTYRGYTFIGNLKSVDRLYWNLISTSGLSSTSTFTITDGTFTRTFGNIRADRNIGSGVIGAADNGAGLIRITTTNAHNLLLNDYVTITGVVGTVEANGGWLVTPIGANTFDLQGSAFVNAYVSDGTINNINNRGSSVASSAAGAGGKVRYATSYVHGLTTSDYVLIVGDTGTPLANGVRRVTVVSDSTHFDIDVTWVANGTPTVDLFEDIGTTPRFFRVTTDSFTTSQKIDATAQSICKTIALNGLWNSYYISGVNDPVGKMLIESLNPGMDEFSIIADSTTTGGCFSPTVPTSGTNYNSTSENSQNAYMWSKAGQSEAYPLANMGYIGNAGDPIIKIVALRDSLFFIKQKDGVFRLTGDNPSNFIVTEFDGTLFCSQRNSITKGENSVFMNTDAGFVRFGDTGVENIGNDNLYKDLEPSVATNFASLGYGWFYEPEHTYYCTTMSSPSDTDNTICKAYNTITQSWWDWKTGIYTGDPYIRCGKVISGQMFTAGLTGKNLYLERKSYTTSDLRQPDVPVTITAILGNVVTLAAGITIPLESVLVQGAFRKTIVAINAADEYELSSTTNIILGAATIEVAQVSKIKYQQIHCGVPEYEKEFRKGMLYFDNDQTNIKNLCITTWTDIDSTLKTTLYNAQLVDYWGKKWGIIWGSKRTQDKYQFDIPNTRGTYLYMEICHRIPREQLALCGASIIYDVIGDRGRIE